MPRIFISYRRSTGGDISGHIYEYLADKFGRGNIFKDVDNIPLGEDFRAAIEKALLASTVMLVIIDPNWLNVSGNDGKRRLDSSNDPVRIEIEMGLRHDNLTIIPVLTNNAPMPSAEELPASLYQLSFKNAAKIRNNPDFTQDMQRLIASLKPTPKKVNTRIIAAFFGLLILGLVLIKLNPSLIVIEPTLPASTSAPTAVIFSSLLQNGGVAYDGLATISIQLPNRIDKPTLQHKTRIVLTNPIQRDEFAETNPFNFSIYPIDPVAVDGTLSLASAVVSDNEADKKKYLLQHWSFSRLTEHTFGGELTEKLPLTSFQDVMNFMWIPESMGGITESLMPNTMNPGAKIAGNFTENYDKVSISISGTVGASQIPFDAKIDGTIANT